MAAFAVGGLMASIPVFLDQPASAPAPLSAARYDWIDRLPEGSAQQPVYAGNARVIATAADGQQLLANRLGDDQVCFLLGSSGGGCETVGQTEQIQLVGRVRQSRETAWWGILGGDAAALRARYADGSKKDSNVSYGFGVLGQKGNPAVLFTALDRNGNELGSVRADADVPIECEPSACFVTVTFTE